MATNHDAILAAVALGFQTVGCNPSRLPGVELVAQGPGILEPVWPAQLRAVDGAFVVYGMTADPASGRQTYPELERLADAAALRAWLETNGRPYRQLEAVDPHDADPRD